MLKHRERESTANKLLAQCLSSPSVYLNTLWLIILDRVNTMNTQLNYNHIILNVSGKRRTLKLSTSLCLLRIDAVVVVVVVVTLEFPFNGKEFQRN